MERPPEGSSPGGPTKSRTSPTPSWARQRDLRRCPLLSFAATAIAEVGTRPLGAPVHQNAHQAALGGTSIRGTAVRTEVGSGRRVARLDQAIEVGRISSAMWTSIPPGERAPPTGPRGALDLPAHAQVAWREGGGWLADHWSSEAAGMGAMATEPCRRHGMSSAAFYDWTGKFGGMARIVGSHFAAVALMRSATVVAPQGLAPRSWGGRRVVTSAREVPAEPLRPNWQATPRLRCRWAGGPGG